MAKMSDKKQDAEVMKNMTPEQKKKFAKGDKAMDKKKPSRSKDKEMDKALAKKVKKK